MAKFIIQTRTNLHEIWYTPDTYSLERKAGPMQSDSVDELRETLRQIADTMTLDWWHHYRIITSTGSPVERYRVRPGEMKKTKARY